MFIRSGFERAGMGSLPCRNVLYVCFLSPCASWDLTPPTLLPLTQHPLPPFPSTPRPALCSPAHFQSETGFVVDPHTSPHELKRGHQCQHLGTDLLKVRETRLCHLEKLFLLIRLSSDFPGALHPVNHSFSIL